MEGLNAYSQMTDYDEAVSDLTSVFISTDGASMSSDCVSQSSQTKKRLTVTTLDSYLARKTPMQKKSLDQQVSRFVFATNTSFRSVEHPQFLQLMKDLCTSYILPIRKDVAGNLPKQIYEEKEKCSIVLNSQTVCLGHEPIICVTVTIQTGDVYSMDSIDMSGHTHTADYLTSSS